MIQIEANKTYIAVVEDNDDPKKLGRVRARVLDIFDEILEDKEQSKGFKIIYEPPFLRHFTALFDPIQ